VNGGNVGIGKTNPSTKLDVDGPIAMKTYTNSNRPSASSLAAGTMIYNTDDHAPNFSDGTNWRDAVGNIT
jgi:pentose-5-phosphate-3-epimerase